MSNVLMEISLHADTQHRAVYLSRYQFIWEIIDTSELAIFEAIFRWDTWRRLSTAIHNPMRVMEQSNWLRYSWFSIRSSARSDLLLVSHEAQLTMQQGLPMTERERERESSVKTLFGKDCRLGSVKTQELVLATLLMSTKWQWNCVPHPHHFYQTSKLKYIPGTRLHIYISHHHYCTYFTTWFGHLAELGL